MCDMLVPFPDAPKREEIGRNKVLCVIDAPCKNCPAVMTFEEESGFVRSFQPNRPLKRRGDTIKP
ncbi:MAG: hypothetical protein EBT03_11040 [Betaproteobacteria bacterium]|nr:hypothetical protein [Betaproteobacteria bacterium]NCA17331.1 hypothetical protein [Betaproteobacteria bacterium]